MRWLALLTACKGASIEPQLDVGPFDPPVSCDWDSPGPAMFAGTPEADHDFVARLETLDLRGLPDPLDLAPLQPFERAVANWMIGRSSGSDVTHAELDAAGSLGVAVKAAFAASPTHTLDFMVLREGLQYSYACSRPLPADLSELRARYGDYERWGLIDVPCGLPKDERRRVWSHPEERAVVAETVADDGSTRETEVLFFDLRDDGQVDFAAYTRDGRLMDRSTFATRGGTPATFGSPYICVSCHTGPTRIDVQRPEGLGAGCQGG